MQNIQKYFQQIDKAMRLVRALHNPVRRKIITHLQADGEVPVHKFVERQKQEQSIISQHLGILRENKLVRTRRDGKLIYYSLNVRNMNAAIKLIEKMAAVAK